MPPTDCDPHPFGHLEELEAFLATMGETPSDEAPGISVLDHGLQCAAELETAAPDDLELQLAGLLHDVGHAFAHVRDHGEAGGALLRPLMGERIAGLVALHVRAKRYLVTTEPGYLELLSPASLESLVWQGGAMSPAETAAFEAEPYSADALLLRRADEAAKCPGRPVPGLERWLPGLRRSARP